MECTLKLFLKSAVAFFFLFFLYGISIGNGQKGISYNGSRINEVLKGVAQMFQVSRMTDTPFKILFNPLLTAAAVSCYKVHSERCTKGLFFFFLWVDFLFSLKIIGLIISNLHNL